MQILLPGLQCQVTSATDPDLKIFDSTSFNCNLSRRLTPSNNRLPSPATIGETTKRYSSTRPSSLLQKKVVEQGFLDFFQDDEQLGSSAWFALNQDSRFLVRKELFRLGYACEFPVPLQEIVDRVAKGIYKAKPAAVFSFDEIREAQRLMESGKATGKITVKVSITGTKVARALPIAGLIRS